MCCVLCPFKVCSQGLHVAIDWNSENARDKRGIHYLTCSYQYLKGCSHILSLLLNHQINQYLPGPLELKSGV